MKLDRLTPMLWVNDIETTIRYYVDILGFTELNYSIEDGWAIIKKDSIRVMFSLPNAHYEYQKPNLTGSLYFNTSSVDECGKS